MNGLYHFPLYYQRLLASTIGWTDEEFGAYVRLLIYQFDKGSIPKDKKNLIRIAPSSRKNWGVLSKKFNETFDGNLINNVMEEVRQDSIVKNNKNKLNGHLGGRPKKQTVSVGKPNGSQNNNPNHKLNETIHRNTETQNQYSSSWADKIFETLRRATTKEFSDDLLRYTATRISALYSEKDVKHLGNLCAKFMQDLTPDNKPKNKNDYV